MDYFLTKRHRIPKHNQPYEIITIEPIIADLNTFFSGKPEATILVCRRVCMILGIFHTQIETLGAPKNLKKWFKRTIRLLDFQLTLHKAWKRHHEAMVRV